MEKIKDMEEQLKANATLMQQYEKSFEQRLKEAKEQESEVFKTKIYLFYLSNFIKDYQIDYTKPFLMNLNEDPLLNGKIYYSLTDGEHYLKFGGLK